MDRETVSRRAAADQVAGGAVTPLPPTAQHDPWRAGWIEDERRFRDEGTVFGLAESAAAVESKEESIRQYFAAWKARSEAQRRDLVEWAAELRRRHAEAWARIEALERTLAETGNGLSAAQAAAAAQPSAADAEPAGPLPETSPVSAVAPASDGGNEREAATSRDPAYHRRYAPPSGELSIETGDGDPPAANQDGTLPDGQYSPIAVASGTGTALIDPNESNPAPTLVATPATAELGGDAVHSGDPGHVDGGLPRLVSAVALTLAICALNYVLVLELLKGVFERPALVAAGVVLAGFFTLLAPRSLLGGGDAEDRYGALDPARLAEIGMPITAALFIAVWAVPAPPAGMLGRVVLFLFLAGLFFFVSRMVLRLGPESAPAAGRAVAAQRERWNAWSVARRLRSAARTERNRLIADRERLFGRANLLEAELMHTGEGIRALPGPAEIEAMRDHRLALFRSELELARFTRRNDDARAKDVTEEVPHESL